jgi:hypothetical protein
VLQYFTFFPDGDFWPTSVRILLARLPIHVFRIPFFGPQKHVSARIPEDFFFSCFFPEEFLHRSVVWEGSCKFLFSAAFTGFFCRNSCGIEITVFAQDSSGFLLLRILVPTKSCLARTSDYRRLFVK